MRGKVQGVVELVQALVEALSRVNAADALALHKKGGPFAKQAAGLVDPLFFRRVKLKPTAAAHAAAGGGGGALLLSSWLCGVGGGISASGIAALLVQNQRSEKAKETWLLCLLEEGRRACGLGGGEGVPIECVKPGAIQSTTKHQSKAALGSVRRTRCCSKAYSTPTPLSPLR